MHVDRRVRALHPSLSAPESFRTSSWAHNLLPPLAHPPPSFAFSSPPALRHLLFRFFLAADVIPVFPPSFLVLEPLTLKSFFSFYSFAVPRLDRFCLSGTYEARGACNCARHIAYGPRSATWGVERRGGRVRSKTTSSVLRLRRNKFFFFRFLFSPFRSSPLSLSFRLFLSPFSSSLCYERSW